MINFAQQIESDIKTNAMLYSFHNYYHFLACVYGGPFWYTALEEFLEYSAKIFTCDQRNLVNVFKVLRRTEKKRKVYLLDTLIVSSHLQHLIWLLCSPNQFIHSLAGSPQRPLCVGWLVAVLQFIRMTQLCSTNNNNNSNKFL